MSVPIPFPLPPQIIQLQQESTFAGKALAVGGVVVLGLVGYGVYDAFFSSDKCKSGILSSINPICAFKISPLGVSFEFFKQTKDIGVGTPVGLESCPEGWHNDGLTCREPLGWNSECVYWNWGALGGYWTGCATGGQVIGRLNNGGTCPADREKIDGLCYKRCDPGWTHVEGMPYLCRDEASGNLWDNLVGGARNQWENSPISWFF